MSFCETTENGEILYQLGTSYELRDMISNSSTYLALLLLR